MGYRIGVTDKCVVSVLPISGTTSRVAVLMSSTTKK